MLGKIIWSAAFGTTTIRSHLKSFASCTSLWVMYLGCSMGYHHPALKYFTVLVEQVKLLKLTITQMRWTRCLGVILFDIMYSYLYFSQLWVSCGMHYWVSDTLCSPLNDVLMFIHLQSGWRWTNLKSQIRVMSQCPSRGTREWVCFVEKVLCWSLSPCGLSFRAIVFLMPHILSMF